MKEVSLKVTTKAISFDINLSRTGALENNLIVDNVSLIGLN